MDMHGRLDAFDPEMAEAILGHEQIMGHVAPMIASENYPLPACLACATSVIQGKYGEMVRGILTATWTDTSSTPRRAVGSMNCLSTRTALKCWQLNAFSSSCVGRTQTIIGQTFSPILGRRRTGIFRMPYVHQRPP